MKKIGLKSQKLVEISRFENLIKLRFHLGMIQKNALTYSSFEIKGSSFGFGLIFILATNGILRLRL